MMVREGQYATLPKYSPLPWKFKIFLLINCLDMRISLPKFNIAPLDMHRHIQNTPCEKNLWAQNYIKISILESENFL